MAKKPTPAKPQPASLRTPAPEFDSSKPSQAPKPASRRRAAGTTTRAPRLSKSAADAVSAVESAVPPRRTRKPKVPTQASEQTLTPARVTPDTVTDEDIRIRAYFLSLERGPHGGSDIDYWLQAERELRVKRKS